MFFSLENTGNNRYVQFYMYNCYWHLGSFLQFYICSQLFVQLFAFVFIVFYSLLWLCFILSYWFVQYSLVFCICLVCFAMFCYMFGMFCYGSMFSYFCYVFARFCYVFATFCYVLLCFCYVFAMCFYVFAMCLLCVSMFCYFLLFFCSVSLCFCMFSRTPPSLSSWSHSSLWSQHRGPRTQYRMRHARQAPAHYTWPLDSQHSKT